ncbi:MAG: chitobiase/beta-hexosaminidase C-terminal domain-containing protein, partial [Verrucomicrobia bacterium]|nr:chitobiase/beta-hexosaminidase C-terminal domain-containing protein [Verrucomicrobiota bacterium]
AGDGEAVTLERPWITRPAQAAFAAADHLRRKSQAPAAGKAVVLRDRVPWLVPGVPFQVDDKRAGIQLLCRCLSIQDAEPPSGLRTVSFEAEDAFTPLPFLDAAGDVVDEAQPDPEEVTLFRLLQPPPAMTGEEAAVAVLVARTSKVTTAVKVWFQEADAALFTDLGTQRGFAVHGTLQANYSSTPGTGNPPDDNSEDLRLTVHASTVASDLALLSQTQSADAISDGRVLVWVFKASGEFEVMTLKAARVATGETFWRLKVRRARFGTKKLGFSTADAVFVIRRAAVEAYTHRLFGAYSVTGTPATFRLQASNPWKTAQLSDPAVCPDLAFTFGDAFAPAATWTRIEYRPPAGAWGDVATFAGDFDTGGTWRLSWTCTDPNSDLASCILRSLGPEPTQAVLFSGAASGAETSFRHEFTLPEGDWDLVLKVMDRAGRARIFPLAPVGGGAAVVVRSRPVSTTIVGNPVAVPRGGDVFAALSVALTCTTSGATIEYQVVALGAAAGGSWSTYSAPVSVSPDQTLYARGVKAGMTTSPTVRHDYRWLDPETV